MRGEATLAVILLGAAELGFATFRSALGLLAVTALGTLPARSLVVAGGDGDGDGDGSGGGDGMGETSAALAT